MSLLQEEWCWKEKSIEIEVTDKDLSDVNFVQSGYILSCSLSHDIILVSPEECLLLFSVCSFCPRDSGPMVLHFAYR